MQQSNDPGTPVPAHPEEPAGSALSPTAAHAATAVTGATTAATELELHDSAAIFPPMRESEFAALVADIQEKGQLEPLWTHQGKVIDGRHRLRACRQLGLTPKTREWDGNGSLLEFIVSANLRRRHLKENQRAMVAARMFPHFEDEVEQRRNAPPSTRRGTNWCPGKTRHVVGKIFSVSGTSVDRARRLLQNGTPELVGRVDQGTLAVSTAAKIAELPHDEQQRLLTLDRRELAAHFRPAKRVRPEQPAPALQRELTEADVRRDEAFIKALPGGQANLKRCAEGLRLKVTKADWYNELAQLFRNPYFPDLLDRGVVVIRSDEREK